MIRAFLAFICANMPLAKHSLSVVLAVGSEGIECEARLQKL